MGLILRQFSVLLWKCWLLRKRHYVSTLFEIILPLVTSAIVAAAYSSIVKTAVRIKPDGDGAEHPPEKFPFATFNFRKKISEFGRKWDKIPIFYAPDGDFGTNITHEMNNVLKKMVHKVQINFYPFANESELFSFYLQLSANGTKFVPFVGVIFDEESSPHFKYKIRLLKSFVGDTTKMFPLKTNPGPYSVDTPYLEQFAPLQVLVNEAYLNLLAEANQTFRGRQWTSNVLAYKLPYPKYMKRPKTVVTLIDRIPLIIIFGFIVTSPIIVKRLADEKVNGSREMYKLMGLSDWVYWGSTFLNYFAINAIQCIPLTLLYVIRFNGYIAIINYTNAVVIYLFFLLYGMAFILISMMLSVPFNRPVFGVVVAVIVWTISYVLPLYFVDPTITKNIDTRSTDVSRLFSCLLPNMALHFNYRLISQKEVYGVGVTFGNLFEPVPVFGSLSPGLIMLMLLVSSLISGVLIWYLEAVWPWQFGVPKPFYFPFLKAYWLKRGRKPSTHKVDSTYVNHSHFERQMSNCDTAITIKSLSKEFGIRNKKTALRNVNLNVNRGQITVLLGHNGAGKSTTMNIITGMFPPTSGSVEVEGHDVAVDSKLARQSMSLCPQHNVLYGELTVSEHLKLYGVIKGITWDAINSQVHEIMDNLSLHLKKDVPAAVLSGGMKRKLSLGVALMGNSKVVILDEPTSGMDPDARRSVWDLLLSVRKNCAILLTTHYMEEADALGDRIAIMAAGEVKCCGSPMFLKRIFGTGYQLRISTAVNYKQNEFHCLVQRYFPRAAVVSEMESEVVFNLGESSNELVKKFFGSFEHDHKSLGVLSCGLSVTTIEDVFLEVSSRTEEVKQIDKSSLNFQPLVASDISSVDFQTMWHGSVVPENLTNCFLRLQRLRGLLVKRFHFSKRYCPMMFFQLIVPSLIFLLILYIDSYLKHNEQKVTQIALNLQEMYGQTYTFFQGLDHATKPDFDFGKIYYQFSSLDEDARMLTIGTSQDTNDYLINKTEETSLSNYISSYIVGCTLNRSLLVRPGRVYNVWYNNEALHSLPASIDVLYNGIMKEITGNADGFSISVSSEPFPTVESDIQSIMLLQILSVMWSVLVPISLPFIAASYVLFPVHERASKAKLLQLMTGLHPAWYWFANYVFDMVTHSVCCALIVGIFFWYDKYSVFVGHMESAFGLCTLLFVFGLASTPMAYVISFLPEKPSSGFAVLVIFFLVFGVILSVVDLILLLSIGSLISQTFYDTLSWVFRSFSIMSMTKGIVKLYKLGAASSVCKVIAPSHLSVVCANITASDPIFGCCADKCKVVDKCYEWRNPFRWGSEGILEEIFMLSLNTVVFICILACLESNFMLKLQYFYISSGFRKRVLLFTNRLSSLNHTGNISAGPIEDSDVVAENVRVRQLLSRSAVSGNVLLTNNLSKKFDNFTAVNKLTFGVYTQECFGLLGVNGAGKTTTFRMLVGDLFPTLGNAFCNGYNLVSSLKSFQEQIGYCPQFDAVLTKLTGREMLYLFGRLRGLNETELKASVEELLVMTDLISHADRRTETYSGGTKRKLSLAIALIGSPRLLFLDEPSAGLDPGARRKIWRTLAYIKNHYGCSIVLTSHNMDECEALCNRIAIMVNGEFKCLGSLQHLKGKFGQGYTLNIKIKRENMDPDYLEKVKKSISNTFPSAVLKDYNETILNYHLTNTSLRWTHLFTVMEREKELLDLEDYAISDTTLEQIFLSFARNQQPCA